MSEDDVTYGLEDTIKKIMHAKPELTREELLEKIEDKRKETGYLLNLEGAAFLVASDLGITLQNGDQIETRMKIKDIIAKLRDVTIIARVIIVYPVTEFTRPDGSVGKLQRLLIGDETGTVDVCIWNRKVDVAANQKIMENSAVKIEHAYSKESINGQFELHIGDRGKISLIQDEKIPLPKKHNFYIKISNAKKGMKNFNSIGTIVRVFPVKQFNREDGEGKVQRLRIKDETGEINLVIWNLKLEETEPLDVGDKIEVMRGSIKENIFGELEIHVGKRSIVKILAKGVKNVQIANDRPLTISQISPGLRGITVECAIQTNFGVKDVNLKDGSTVKVSELMLKDSTGEIKLSAWREHAEMLSKFPAGVRVRLKNVTSKQGFRDNIELATTNSTVIESIPTE